MTNVVLICLDTFRADCLAARGLNKTIKTPNLDRLAREGVLCENAFGEGQPTIQFRRALCTGMRSFPFDREVDCWGLWPSIPGWHRIPREQPTLAEILLDNGYVTGMAASCYHMFKATQNFTRGIASWDFIRGHESDPWRMGPHSSINLKKWSRPETNPPSTLATLTQFLLNNRDRRGPDDYIPARLFASAVRFIEDNHDNQPFFLWVDSFSPHEPWDPPRAYADAYDPNWDQDWLPIFCRRGDVSDEIKRRVVAQYYGELTHVDHHVGRLLDALDKRGLADNTLVMVVSDHGAEMFDHGGIIKEASNCRYRHNAEILCVTRFPGRQYAGRRVPQFVLSHDLAPTILDVVGVKQTTMQGVSFMPFVRGEQAPSRDHIVTGWSGSRPRAAVRDEQYAYSCFFAEDAPDDLLFDTQADRAETRNLAGERPEIVERCRRRLRDYLGALPYHGTKFIEPYTPPFARLAKTRWAEHLNQENPK